MQYSELPAKLTPYNPELRMPDYTGMDHKARRAAFNAWVTKNYPTDIVICRKDFIKFLLHPFDHKGTYITTIVGRTDPDFLEKHPVTGRPNPYIGKMKKVCRRTVVAGNWSYRNAVMNARERQWCKFGGPIFGSPPTNAKGEIKQFIPLPGWGERVAGTTFVVHKGSLYVYVRVLETLRVEYRIGKTKVNPALVEPYLREKSSNADWQGVLPENEVIVRKYGFPNVECATFCGRHLFVLD